MSDPSRLHGIIHFLGCKKIGTSMACQICCSMSSGVRVYLWIRYPILRTKTVLFPHLLWSLFIRFKYKIVIVACEQHLSNFNLRYTPIAAASNSNIPLPPPPPRPRPQPHSHQTRHHHRQKRALIAPGPIAHLLHLAPNLRLLHPGLIHPRVDGAPDGGAGGRHDGHDAPVRAEVLDAPDDGDDDGAEGEDGAVAEADEGGDEGEEGGVGLHGCGGEEELAEREEEGGG